MPRGAMVALVAALLWPFGSLQGQADRIGVDPRVELMSILFRLAGNNEYNQCRVPRYDRAIDDYFKPYRDHEAVKLARQLVGIGFDAPMNLAVHLQDVESLTERVPFDRPDSRLDERWHGIQARPFLEAVRRFVADTKFPAFLKSQQTLYSVTDIRLRAFVDTHGDLPWFNRFFGARTRARFIIIPGLANGGPSYGPSVLAEDGVEEIFAIPGVWEVDGEDLPRFSGDWLDTMVHEFVHSYSNPLVDQFAAKMEKAGRAINEPIQEQMRAQGYGPWKTLLYESLVRASTVRYILEHEGDEAARRSTQKEQSRSFLWTGELVELLGDYEKHRDQYPTLATFMPKIVAFFDDVAGRMPELMRRYDESRPKVTSMNISNGAQDVDPELKEIVIRFDRPMQREHYAVNCVNGVECPKFGKPSFDQTGTVFRLPVILEPEKEYGFRLNWPGGGSFQSLDGVPLKHLSMKFHCRSPGRVAPESP